MHTQSEPQSPSPAAFISLNPSIRVHTPDKHGGLHVKAHKYAQHTHIHAQLVPNTDWLSTAEAGIGGGLRSHGVCAAVILYCTQGQFGLHHHQQKSPLTGEEKGSGGLSG